MSVEVILVVVLVAFMCFVVGVGRVAQGRQLADQAAAEASRDASLASSPGQAREHAHRSALAALAGAGRSCTRATVSTDVTQFRAGGQVAVTVECTADLSGLGPAGLPDRVRVTATWRTPLDTYRSFSGTPP
jgi:Flp pilus assembly protein TadG